MPTRGVNDYSRRLSSVSAIAASPERAYLEYERAVKGAATAQDDRAWSELARRPPQADVLLGYLSPRITRLAAFFAALPLGGDRGKRVRNWAVYALGEAAVIGFRATGDLRFLDPLAATLDGAVVARDHQLGIRDELRGRVVRSWGSILPESGLHTCEVTPAGTITHAMALFCEATVAHPEAAAVHGERAERYLAAMPEIFAEFDEDVHELEDDPGAAYYRSPFDGIVEPVNHVAPFAAANLRFHCLTGDAEALNRASMCTGFFRRALRREPNGAYAWAYRPTPEDLTPVPGEQIIKAATTLCLPFTAINKGFFFDAADRAAFVATLLESAHRGDGEFDLKIDQAPSRPLVHDSIAAKHRRSRMPSLAEWTKLGHWDPRVWKVIEDTVAVRRDLFAPLSWFGSPRSAVGYAHRLLRDSSGSL